MEKEENKKMEKIRDLVALFSKHTGAEMWQYLLLSKEDWMSDIRMMLRKFATDFNVSPEEYVQMMIDYINRDPQNATKVVEDYIKNEQQNS